MKLAFFYIKKKAMNAMYVSKKGITNEDWNWNNRIRRQHHIEFFVMKLLPWEISCTLSPKTFYQLQLPPLLLLHDQQTLSVHHSLQDQYLTQKIYPINENEMYLNGFVIKEALYKIAHNVLAILRVTLNSKYVVSMAEHLHPRLLRTSNHLPTKWNLTNLLHWYFASFPLSTIDCITKLSEVHWSTHLKWTNLVPHLDGIPLWTDKKVDRFHESYPKAASIELFHGQASPSSTQCPSLRGLFQPYHPELYITPAHAN